MHPRPLPLVLRLPRASSRRRLLERERRAAPAAPVDWHAFDVLHGPATRRRPAPRPGARRRRGLRRGPGLAGIRRSSARASLGRPLRVPRHAGRRAAGTRSSRPTRRSSERSTRALRHRAGSGAPTSAQARRVDDDRRAVAGVDGRHRRRNKPVAFKGLTLLFTKDDGTISTSTSTSTSPSSRRSSAPGPRSSPRLRPRRRRPARPQVFEQTRLARRGAQRGRRARVARRAGEERRGRIPRAR